MPHMKPTFLTLDQQIAALERIGRFIAPFTRWDRDDLPVNTLEEIRAADHWLCQAIMSLRKRRWITAQPRKTLESHCDPSAAEI